MTDDDNDGQNRLLNPARAYAAWGNDNCQYNDKVLSLFSYLDPHEGGSSD